ncbi:OPT oligopeptide transporter protein-domain-containing protein [Cantharellus anzutake]|uniref:OPT oligopeptide transporter protein-domain-containing protein n=1 Tax=Cantharellus anzutake TaxID=1750568 RepID=UPI001907FEAC|nr:OPT oligopeptide transporter protein-domain-containing protein [Cantharellus anzutake]KAF8328081.1 OPT oligopeptide transporter protein-domain-containing protein [Cantharellus anzutake]
MDPSGNLGAGEKKGFTSLAHHIFQDNHVAHTLPPLFEPKSAATTVEREVNNGTKYGVIEGAEGSVNKEVPLGSPSINREPVIESGEDVSNFVIDDRDDGDPAVTFRSFVLGTIIAGLGAALAQIYIFKPTDVTVSGIFLMLIIYTSGNVWANLFPQAHFFEKRGWSRAARVFTFVNPGPFGLKEHVIATVISSSASGTSTAVQNFAVQKLFYSANVNATTAVLATFSTGMFGYGLVGLLRPLTVYPAEMVYWGQLPIVTVFQSLHWDKKSARKRLKLFWTAFTGIALWEVFPAYIFPTLNGVSLFCIASVTAPTNIRTVFMHIFGGGNANEGLGLGSLSLDWQYIGSEFMSKQIRGLVMQFVTPPWQESISETCGTQVIFQSAKNYPMLSTSIFNLQGDRYNQTFVFGTKFQLNETALAIEGLPQLTGTTVWTYMTSCWSRNWSNTTGPHLTQIGGLIAHCMLFWRGYVWDSFKLSKTGKQPDRHWIAMQKYEEVEWWWYIILLALAFFAGLIVIIKGNTTLPWYGYIIALLGSFVTPFSNLLYARLGNGIATNQLMKMVAGALHPGKPVSNLYFSMWSHDVVGASIGLAGDLKMGQYLKIPPRALFMAQIWGTLLGAFINYAVMTSIIDSQKDTLLDPIGTNVWSGATVQSLNSAAVTWSLAGKIYGASGPYVWKWLLCSPDLAYDKAFACEVSGTGMFSANIIDLSIKLVFFSLFFLSAMSTLHSPLPATS